MFNNANRNNWTNQKLISLSKNLAQGYGLIANNSKQSKGSDSWTTDKFIKMSRYLSSAYGVDF